MKMKKKGKVYPSPSSSSSHEGDSLSIFQLLPATILVLVSILSSEDREVLAYLITRGTTISSSSSSYAVDSRKKKESSRNHKPPVFDCECFDCYTNYWFRWDSSPNRDLIHDIIEAYENHHLTIAGENSDSGNKSKRGKKKEKPSRRVSVESKVSESHVSSGRLSEEAEVAERMLLDEEEVSTVVFAAVAESRHKGLARKVLPDVLGLFNSNFWRLWNPNA